MYVLVGLESSKLHGVVLKRPTQREDVRLERAHGQRCNQVDIGVGVVLVEDQTCAPLDTHMSRSVRAQPRKIGPGQTDLPPRSEARKQIRERLLSLFQPAPLRSFTRKV